MNKNIIKMVALASVIAAGGATPSLSQTTQTAPPMDSVPEKPTPGPVTASPSLTEKLDQSGGVIKPKDVDPAIEKPAPNTHTGDVIQPPTSPNGTAPQAK